MTSAENRVSEPPNLKIFWRSMTPDPPARLLPSALEIIGSLRYGDYGLRTTAGRALSFVCSTGLSRANIER